jgi:hypothetical protein
VEFPSNSNRPKGEEKKVERIVTGKVSKRKRPIGRRLTDTLFGGDAKGALSYVLLEVLIPAARDMVAEAATQTIERLIFGDARPPSRRSSVSGGQTYVNYSRYAKPQQREEPRRLSQRGRTQHDFDEIILDTRAEAESVIDRLFDIISKYEAASVADLYGLVGITPTFVDDKWGWTDFRGAGATRVRDGYLLDLPRPVPLD